MTFDNLFDSNEVPESPLEETPLPIEEQVEEIVETESEPPVEESEEEAPSLLDYFTYNGLIHVPDDFEYDGTEESVSRLVEHSKEVLQQQVAADLIQQLPQDFQPLLQYALAGGTSPDDYIRTFQAPPQYDLSNPEDQEKVLFSYYKATSSYPDDKIQRMISRLKATDDLEVEAVDAAEELKVIAEQRKQQFLQKQQEARLQEEEHLKQYQQQILSSIEEEIEPSRKNKVKSFFFNPIKVDNRVTTYFEYSFDSIKNNPKHLAQLADILTDYTPKEGFNLERFKKQGKTQAAKTFKQLMDEKIQKPSGTSKPSSKDNLDLSKFLGL